MFALPCDVLLLDNNRFLIPIAIIEKPERRQKRCLHQEIQAAAIVQGDIITTLPVFLALGQISFIKPEFCRVLAEGGAGTWFTLDMQFTCSGSYWSCCIFTLHHHYLETVIGKCIRRSANALAWVHVIFINVGTVGSMRLLMYAVCVGAVGSSARRCWGVGMF